MDVTAQVIEVFRSGEGVLQLSQLQLPPSWRLGKHVLQVKYRGVPNIQDSGKLVNQSANLSRTLAQTGIIDGTTRAQNGALTWYKLSEWMQVEIVQMFGESMNHTPWYRFPFVDIIKTYFDVFLKEVLVVAQRHGWMNALGGSGFLTDLIPGVVMSLLFGQMAALAYPLRLAIGDSYEASSLVEQLVVTAPQHIKWSTVDSRITRVSQVVDGLWLLTIPTFKLFTEVLINIAEAIPLATVLQISNQSVIQLKVEILDVGTQQQAVTISDLNHLSGCEVKFQFHYPFLGEQQPNTQVSLAVQVPFLFSVIRYCMKNCARIRIVQIYDFYD
jgi:hypothetical protein